MSFFTKLKEEYKYRARVAGAVFSSLADSDEEQQRNKYDPPVIPTDGGVAAYILFKLTEIIGMVFICIFAIIHSTLYVLRAPIGVLWKHYPELCSSRGGRSTVT